MRLTLLGAAAALAIGLGAQAAHATTAGFIALEGSDATAFHRDPQYTPQLFKYLQGASTLPVLVYDTTGAIDLSSISGGVATTDASSLTGVTFSNFSAVYVESPFGCCSADPTALNGFGTAITAFVAAGGNLSIENYGGGSYDGVVPGGDLTGILGAVEGVGAENNGAGGGPGCTDGETVNANGKSKGFTQPPIDGCWSHQAYESSYWSKLGYNSLIDSSPAFTFGDGTSNGSSFLAFGGTLGAPPTTGVPEPATLGLLGAGLIGLVTARRRAR